ncbi:MAG: hypothetical protein K2Q22_08185 [Cytophagales bacterium]|nr:hypothetical protein [Cytophagales bacterium]
MVGIVYFKYSKGSNEILIATFIEIALIICLYISWYFSRKYYFLSEAMDDFDKEEFYCNYSLSEIQFKPYVPHLKKIELNKLIWTILTVLVFILLFMLMAFGRLKGLFDLKYILLVGFSSFLVAITYLIIVYYRSINILDSIKGDVQILLKPSGFVFDQRVKYWGKINKNGLDLSFCDKNFVVLPLNREVTKESSNISCFIDKSKGNEIMLYIRGVYLPFLENQIDHIGYTIRPGNVNFLNKPEGMFVFFFCLLIVFPVLITILGSYF